MITNEKPVTHKTSQPLIDPNQRVALTRMALSVMKRKTLEELCWGLLERATHGSTNTRLEESRGFERAEGLRSNHE